MTDIPDGINVPGAYISINNKRAMDPNATDPFRVCILGEHGETSDNMEDSYAYQHVLSEADAFSKFGMSPSYEMVRALFSKVNVGSDMEVYVVSRKLSLWDTTSTSLKIQVSGTPETGSIKMLLNGEIYYHLVSSSQTIDEIVTSIETNLATQKYPIQVDFQTDGAMSFTYHVPLNSSGYEYGGCGISENMLTNNPPRVVIEANTSGLLFAMETEQFSGLYGDPNMTQVIDLLPMVGEPDLDITDMNMYIASLPDTVINLFVNPYTDTTNYAILKEEIETRFAYSSQLEGHQVMGYGGTYSQMATQMDDAALNDAHLTLWDCGYERPAPTYVQSAIVAGIIANSISTTDVAVPMQYTDTGLVPEPEENYRQYVENKALVNMGVAIGGVNVQGTLQTLRITTTYTSTNGLDDDSYRDANTVFTASYLRQGLLRTIRVKFPQHKLSDDGGTVNMAAGQKLATPKKVKCAILAWFRYNESLAIVEDYAQFKTQLLVWRNESDVNRIDAIIPPNLVNQFRIFGGELQFLL